MATAARRTTSTALVTALSACLDDTSAPYFGATHDNTHAAVLGSSANRPNDKWQSEERPRHWIFYALTPTSQERGDGRLTFRRRYFSH